MYQLIIVDILYPVTLPSMTITVTTNPVSTIEQFSTSDLQQHHTVTILHENSTLDSPESQQLPPNTNYITLSTTVETNLPKAPVPTIDTHHLTPFSPAAQTLRLFHQAHYRLLPPI